jgi:pimeloyl-ACP methyl ester carboxylesterase
VFARADLEDFGFFDSFPFKGLTCSPMLLCFVFGLRKVLLKLERGSWIRKGVRSQGVIGAYSVRKLVSRRRFLEGSILAVTGSAVAAGVGRPSSSGRASNTGVEPEKGEDFIGLLGGFPAKRPFEVHVTDQHQEDGYVRKRIVYTTEPGIHVPAFLLIPMRKAGDFPLFPGILAIHQDGNRATRDIGKSEPAGLRGDGDQHYGKELALRGYVVLCPDRRGFEEREGEPESSKATLRGDLFDLYRAVDCLLSQPETDTWRGMGVIGHSAGGFMAAMLAFIDSRIRVCAVSCGTWLYRWLKLPGQKVPKGYHVPRPPVPFLGEEMDQDDFLAGIAPRPYLEFHESWTPELDEELPKKARLHYADLGVSERFEWMVHHRGHSFPEDMRKRAYAWIDSWLGAPSGRASPWRLDVLD